MPFLRKKDLQSKEIEAYAHEAIREDRRIFLDTDGSLRNEIKPDFHLIEPLLNIYENRKLLDSGN